MPLSPGTAILFPLTERMMDMKRWLSGLLAALTLFSLTGCGALVADLAGAVLYEEVPQLEAPVDLPDETDSEDPAGLPDETDPEDPDVPEAEDGELPDGLVSGESRSDIPEQVEAAVLPEDGVYTTKEDVALYIYTYGRLPDNFITKKEAQNLGWPGGDLEPYAPGMCIGGNRFGNYEGLLPEAKGRTYTECDIDTLGARSRGAKRIVFSNDGLIYYTEDHYESFELLYGDEGDG